MTESMAAENGITDDGYSSGYSRIQQEAHHALDLPLNGDAFIKHFGFPIKYKDHFYRKIEEIFNKEDEKLKTVNGIKIQRGDAESDKSKIYFLDVRIPVPVIFNIVIMEHTELFRITFLVNNADFDYFREEIGRESIQIEEFVNNLFSLMGNDEKNKLAERLLIDGRGCLVPERLLSSEGLFELKQMVWKSIFRYDEIIDVMKNAADSGIKDGIHPEVAINEPRVLFDFDGIVLTAESQCHILDRCTGSKFSEKIDHARKRPTERREQDFIFSKNSSFSEEIVNNWWYLLKKNQ